MPLLIKSLDVSAEAEISKVSALTARSFFGDTIPANADGITIQFEYYESFSSPVVGLNVDTASIISTPSNMATYDFVVYRWKAPSGFTLHYDTVVFDDFYLRFGDYARGGFALTCRLSDGLQAGVNNAVRYPDNFCGSFSAVRANSSASANLADYYGTMYFTPNASIYDNLNFRPIYYSFDTGGILDSLQFQSIDNYNSSGVTDMFFIIICPYIGSSMSGEPPFTTTTTTGVTSDINVNVTVYVDNSVIESQLDEYLGADDTRITTYETINLGTFPTFDYDCATETVNISQVVSETGDGVNVIWYLISGLFSSVPVLVWLVPFCTFMCVMSFVLWRKGG